MSNSIPKAMKRAKIIKDFNDFYENGNIGFSSNKINLRQGARLSPLSDKEGAINNAIERSKQLKIEFNDWEKENASGNSRPTTNN